MYYIDGDGMWLIIENRAKWKWYQDRLDATGHPSHLRRGTTPRKPYQYRHLGKPKSYPCLVHSVLDDGPFSPNNPYKYHHIIMHYDTAEKLVNMVEEQTK